MDTSDTKSSALFSVEPQDDDRSTEFSLFQALRHWPKVSAYCLSLTSAILLWGFGLAMTGNLSSLPEFQYAFQLSSEVPTDTSEPLEKIMVDIMTANGSLNPNGWVLGTQQVH